MCKVKFSKQREARAFTLIELLTTLSVFALLMTLGFPSIEESIRNNRMSTQNNEMLSMLYYARIEAIRRNASVPVLISSTTQGWDAIVQDPSNEADIEGCVPGQLRCTSKTRVDLTINTAILTYNNRGYIRGADDAWTVETMYLQHENCRGQRQRRRIDISPTGRINSCDLPCDSVEVCPL
ncbi:MAG: prepilin-type N-terminal cleavage/methylation domain-containing protein [Gammaproteobacteria bacterium]|nr:prepilin-type N-terminal cleavage/methylation domain-containing protein [Gammaproteobacteria bacterium]